MKPRIKRKRRKAVTSSELKNGVCPSTKGQHQTWLGMTGDSHPAFCVKCGAYANESNAYPIKDFF